MIRTKLVVISSTAGARLRTVNSSRICSDELSRSGLVHSCGPPLRISLTASLLGVCFEFAVAVELERQGGALGGAEVAALERGENHVLNRIGRVDHPDRHLVEPEPLGGRQSFASV